MTIFRPNGVTDDSQDFDDGVPAKDWPVNPPLEIAKFHFGDSNFTIVGPSPVPSTTPS